MIATQRTAALLLPRLTYKTVLLPGLLLVISGANLFGQDLPSSPTDTNSDAEDPNRRETLKLIADTEAALTSRQFLSAAESFDTAWALSVQREDPLLSINTEGLGALKPGEHRLQAGARARLEQLYTSAPKAFHQMYLQQVAAAAERSRNEAVASGRTRDLVQFILRYQFTDTAQQALEGLIRLQLSRGEFLQAALQYGRLLRLQNDESVEKRAFLATLWWKAGLQEEAIDYLRAAVAAGPGESISLHGQAVNLPNVDQDLNEWLTTHTHEQASAAPPVSEWLQPGGNYRRTMTQATSPLRLEEAWSRSTFYCLQFPELNPILGPLAPSINRQAVLRQAAGEAFVPAAAPLVINDMLVYRCVANIQAVDRKTGEIRWETLPLDRQMEKAVESVRRTDRQETEKLTLVQRVLRNELSSHLTRANCGGELTSDGRFVYAIEDVTTETMTVDLDEQLPRAQIPVNYLRAYDAQSGSFLGQAGGQAGASGRNGRANPMAGMYFLGAPLVMGDRIYVLAENDQGIFLLQLKAGHPWGSESRSEIDLHPVSSQLLTIPKYSLRQHPVRKYSGVIPSYSGGLLICNTCDEQVIAVSAEDHSVRWIHRYYGNVAPAELSFGAPRIGNASSERDSERIDRSNRWLDALPRIAAGRIVLTPRDSDRLICLDLHTGRELWSRPRGALRKLVAVNSQQVVLTGMKIVECLDATSGKPLWKSEITEGNVSGNSCTNGKLLHVPTSAPAIVTFNLSTGRKLVSQPLPENTAANLVCVDDSLISQSMTKVSSLKNTIDQQQSPLAIATKHYFDGHPDDAENVLEQALLNSNMESAEQLIAREVLSTSFLEAIRLNYNANRDRVTRLRNLLTQTSETPEQLAGIVNSMLGMSIADAAVLPTTWQSITRQEKYRRQLEHLVAKGKLSDSNQPAAEVAEAIVETMVAASAEQSHVESTGPLTRRGHRRVAVTLRTAMKLRTPEQQADIRRFASQQLQTLISSVTTPDETQWWIEMCLLSGFVEPAMEAVRNETSLILPTASATALTEFVLWTAAKNSAEEVARSAITTLLLRWDAAKRHDLVSAVLAKAARYATMTQPVVETAPPNPARSLTFSHNLATSALPASLKPDNLEKNSGSLPHAPWMTIPVVTPSAAHSAHPGGPGAIPSHTVQQVLPVFGQMGAFSGWEFIKRSGANVIHAYDNQGRYRWQFIPGVIRKPRGSRGTIQTEYIVAYGNLLAVKMHHGLFMLDCASATKITPPRRLWELNLTTIGAGSSAFTTVSPMPPHQRSTQYDIQPGGFDTVGPVTPHGIPVCAAGQLMVRNTLTGRTEWRATGMPTDAALSATDEELTVISAAAGQVEVRSMIDGSVLRTHPLPEWWTDATENSAISIRDIELEPGEQQRFRIAVWNNQCLLLRRTTEASFVELFDLSQNQVSWSCSLPADSVVSNSVDGHLAILSDGNRLQLLDTMTGRRIADHTVAAAMGSRHLYLRPSAEHWLILTDVFDPDWSNNAHTISNSVPVNGFVYAVNRSSGELSWHTPAEKEFLRISNAPAGIPSTIPTIAPVLLLMKRPWATVTPEGIGRHARYQAKIIDARSGDLLFQDKDLGLNLSNHRIHLDSENNRIEFTFNKRNVVLDYNSKNEESE